MGISWISNPGRIPAHPQAAPERFQRLFKIRIDLSVLHDPKIYLPRCSWCFFFPISFLQTVIQIIICHKCVPTFKYIYILNIALFKLRIGYYFSKQHLTAYPTLYNHGACNMARRTMELSWGPGRPTISAGTGMQWRSPDFTQSAIHFSSCNKSTLFCALTWARKTEHSIVLVIMHI